MVTQAQAAHFKVHVRRFKVCFPIRQLQAASSSCIKSKYLLGYMNYTCVQIAWYITFHHYCTRQYMINDALYKSVSGIYHAGTRVCKGLCYEEKIPLQTQLIRFKPHTTRHRDYYFCKFVYSPPSQKKPVGKREGESTYTTTSLPTIYIIWGDIYTYIRFMPCVWHVHVLNLEWQL